MQNKTLLATVAGASLALTITMMPAHAKVVDVYMGLGGTALHTANSSSARTTDTRNVGNANENQIEDEAFGGSLFFGMRASKRWNVELALGGLQFNGENTNPSNIDHREYTAGVDAFLFPWRDNDDGTGFQPYMVMGAGAVYRDFKANQATLAAIDPALAAEDKAVEPSLNIGLGAAYYLRNGIGVRADIRERLTYAEENAAAATHKPRLIEPMANLALVIPLSYEAIKAPAPVPTPVEPTRVEEPKPVDADQDGVMDNQDACLGTPAGTAVDARGCALPAPAPVLNGLKDSDDDGVVDGRDQCPNSPAGSTVDGTGCAPQPVAVAPTGYQDTDGDGVINEKDQCPNSPANSVVDGTGCPPKAVEPVIIREPATPSDTDRDGVLDINDACPATPYGVQVDSRGCTYAPPVVINPEPVRPIYVPEPVRPTQIAPATTQVVRVIRFATDSATLSKSAKAELSRVARVLKSQHHATVYVTGHADSVGSDDYNMALSQKRAQAVSDYLKAAGVKTGWVVKAAKGENKPTATNRTSKGRAANRRVVVSVPKITLPARR